MSRGGLAKMHMRGFCLGLAATACLASSATAGPPYETDDPAPTDLGHWEIYLFGAADGLGGAIDGSAGVDLNYGALKDLQLTATLPVDVARDQGHWRANGGDVELGAKYRFVHDEAHGVSVALFPRVILPTASHVAGPHKARLLLPAWAQKDHGDWSLFGGGGYELNPGRGNRDFWVASLAATRQVRSGLSVGAEITHEGPPVDGASSVTSLGLGSILSLTPTASLLVSGGPRFEAGHTGYRAYAAIGFTF